MRDDDSLIATLAGRGVIFGFQGRTGEFMFIYFLLAEKSNE